MKKLSRVNVLLSLGLGLTFTWPVLAEDKSWSVAADLQMHTANYRKPSAKQGEANFKLPELSLEMRFQPDTDVELITSAVAKDSRDQTNGRANIQLEIALIRVFEVIEDHLHFDYGLIPNTWVKQEDEVWQYTYLGTQSEMLMRKSNYLSVSDLGMGFWGKGENFFWSLQVTNGEGVAQDETGSRKESLITAKYRFFEALTVSLGYVQGAYDQIEATMAHKERALALLYYKFANASIFGLECFQGKDPVDGINLKVADQVNLTSYGGQRALSKGYSLFLDLQYGLKYSFFAKYDWINPMQDVASVDYRSQLLGIGFFPRRNLQFSLAFSDVTYGDLHNTAIRDTQYWAFGARLQFL